MSTSNFLTRFPEFESLVDSEQTALEEYYNSVSTLAENGWNLEFNNRDQYHASIVMSALLNNASRTVEIFSGCFDDAICNTHSFKESLKNALERDITVSIIFENNPDFNSPSIINLKNLSSQFPMNVSVRVLNDGFKNRFDDTNPLHHFMIVDQSSFRYEIGKNDFKAFCNFDDKGLVEKLKENFNILQINATPVDQL